MMYPVFAAVSILISPGVQQAKRVAIVVNEASSESVAVADYYAGKRGIPASHIIRIKTTTDRKVKETDFATQILAPIRSRLKELPTVDFVVMTKGVPIRILNDADWGVDALIAAHPLQFTPMSKSPSQGEMRSAISPYFQKREPFSRKSLGFYLVTRLDGYTLAEAKALVDRSLAARPAKGPLLFDIDPSKPDSSYNNLNAALKNAHEAMVRRGFKSTLDDSSNFVKPSQPLMGYVSWGSNDSRFNDATYKSIRFVPGAIAETFVSTSARRIFEMKDDPNTQSLIGDLIRGGVTGVKGYVSEPYSVSLCRPDVLFERYASGFNLAESFYMASPFLKWKDLVIGDPLCAPFADPKTGRPPIK